MENGFCCHPTAKNQYRWWALLSSEHRVQHTNINTCFKSDPISSEMKWFEFVLGMFLGCESKRNGRIAYWFRVVYLRLTSIDLWNERSIVRGEKDTEKMVSAKSKSNMKNHERHFLISSSIRLRHESWNGWKAIYENRKTVFCDNYRMSVTINWKRMFFSFCIFENSSMDCCPPLGLIRFIHLVDVQREWCARNPKATYWTQTLIIIRIDRFKGLCPHNI